MPPMPMKCTWWDDGEAVLDVIAVVEILIGEVCFQDI